MRNVTGNKYRNVRVTKDGIKFDSKREASYYERLKDEVASGDILGFDLQPTFELQPGFIDQVQKKQRAIVYRADFIVYRPSGEMEIVDVKGFQTKEFKIKWKLLQYQYRDKGYKFSIV